MSERQVTKHWTMLGKWVESEHHFSKYVKADQVSCFAPNDLLKHHSIQPSTVDFLMVDAEGYDGPIVSSFLEVGGFDPKIIIFEQIHLKAKALSDVLTHLESRGYVHGCPMTPEGPKCKDMNVMALKKGFDFAHPEKSVS